LIVDDEQFNIEAMKIILQYKYYIDVENICDEALFGADAIEIIKKDVEKNNECSYNLIIIDCNMEPMSG
jgi:CheY-like chemotaxis protein